MSASLVQCVGCKKFFTPKGHSQHLNRTKKRDCQDLRKSLQGQAASQVASSLAPNTNPESWGIATDGDNEDSGNIDYELDHVDDPSESIKTQSGDEQELNKCLKLINLSKGSRAQDTGPNPANNVTDSGDQDSSSVGYDSDQMDDPADTADANAFETMFQDQNLGRVTPEHDPPCGRLSPTPPPDAIEPETHNSEARSSLFIDRFPHGHPGAPVSGTGQASVFEAMHNTTGDLIWAPFRSQCDWEIARWAKMRGPTSTAVMELLAIPEVVDRLGLSYRTTKELNDIIDKALPGRPPFQCEDLTIEGEDLQFHYREIIPCIRNLFGNPEFAGDLVYAPERHYVDAKRTCCVYNEMHTGEWWWTVQMSLEARNPSATVIPLIISTDKTQLTLFHDPIRACGETGLTMLSGDGTWHRCHPIFATFVGDYLEQTLVTCTLNGRCSKCLVPPNQLGNFWHFPARNHMEVLDTYNLANEDTHQFHATCCAKGLKPIF
ncbi:hypothetical protein BJY52DRAFT_1229557 [Lactarius psammicola]|nr:hypothetical protein BJY52DRAFT_1229557 [Lactarius psammicola]